MQRMLQVFYEFIWSNSSFLLWPSKYCYCKQREVRVGEIKFAIFSYKLMKFNALICFIFVAARPKQSHVHTPVHTVTVYSTTKTIWNVTSWSNTHPISDLNVRFVGEGEWICGRRWVINERRWAICGRRWAICRRMWAICGRKWVNLWKKVSEFVGEAERFVGESEWICGWRWVICGRWVNLWENVSDLWEKLISLCEKVIDLCKKVSDLCKKVSDCGRRRAIFGRWTIFGRMWEIWERWWVNLWEKVSEFHWK